MDQFPSAFERFEDTVDVSRFRDYARLRQAFVTWAGFRWVDSMEQERALRREALMRGFPIRGELVRGRGRFEPFKRRTAIIAPVEPARPRVVRFRDRLGRFHFRDVKTGRFVRFRRTVT